MSVYRVIDKLEGYVRSGTWLPFGMRILSEERLSEFIEKVRATLPEEVGRAKVIASNKDRVIRDAQAKAEQIVSEAATAQLQMIDDTDILRQARTTADIVLREAEEKALKIRQGADAYAAQLLGELEARLAGALGSVKKGQEALTARGTARAAAQAAVPASAPQGQLTDAAARSKRAAFDAQTAAQLESVEVVS